jgi:hypothetical protein
VLVLLVAYWVDQYRREETLTMIRAVTIALVTPIVLSLPRIFAGQSILQSGDQTAGEGSPLFIWSIISGSNPSSNLMVSVIGLALIVMVARWASQLPFDFRLEPLIAVLIVIQILTSPSIAPQIFTHLIWILVLAIPRKSFLLGFSIVPIMYVASVWLRFEAGIENGKGISDQIYSLVCVALWFALLEVARRCIRVMTVQGNDEVMQSLSVAMSDSEASTRIIKVN